MSRRDQGWSRSTVLVTLGVTVVVLGPLLVRGGIALRGDMVFVPDQPWKSAWLGLNGSTPRAVPMDAVVSVLDELVGGAVLQRLLLVAAFVLGGLGIARLCRDSGPLARAAAVVVYLWNPWVLERLEIGQWPMVLGYGLLPWLVVAAGRLREGEPGAWWSTSALLVLCGVCAPSMGLVAALVAIALVVVARDAKRTLGVLGAAVLANLPWAVPALLGPGLRADPDQFEAFAARGESALGTLASLVSMGGIWKSSIVPPERTQVVVVGLALLFSVAFLAALRRPGRPGDPATARGLLIAAGSCLVIAYLPSVEPIGRALGTLSTDVPAIGILRDSHRYLAPLGLVLALGASALVERLLEHGRFGRTGLPAVAVLVAIAPVVLLPSMAWGITGDLDPVRYPADWDRVARITDPAGKDPGAVVVLPWHGNYRGFGWNDDRALLDPAERYLKAEVLTDDRLFLGDRVLGSEDALLGRVGEALASADAPLALRELGVRWVLVEKENGVADTAVPAGTTAYDGPSLRLVDLGEPLSTVREQRDPPVTWLVLAADFVALLLLCVSFWQLTSKKVRIRHLGE